MKIKTLSIVALGMAFMFFVAAPVHAAKKKAAPDPEMEANLAKMKEMGTPGAEHAVLNPLEGIWTVTERHWDKPGAKAQSANGTSIMAWVMGNRFLKEDFQGEMMGQSYQGLGYFGYDKVKKEYVSVWMDSLGTGLFEGSGPYDPATKTLTQSGTFNCPIAGPNQWFEWHWKIINNDKNVFSLYMKDPEGKEFKTMEVVYKRAK